MSWLFSRALVEAYSAGICSDGAPSAPSSGTPMPQAFWSPGRTTDTSPRFPSGMTCRPLTADLGAALLTSCLEASLARTSAPPERALESTASDPACGRAWLGSLARYDRDSSSWRTPQCSLLAGLDVYSETWPRWGTMHDGVCWAQLTPERRTNESASGSWPTPQRVDGKGASAGSTFGQRARQWTAWGGAVFDGGTLYPNPLAYEVLMGWPMGWTALAPLAMDRFRQWFDSHGRR